MAPDWKAGFFTQAYSDYLMYRGLNRLKIPKCHVFHYLQMFTEKASKAGFAGGMGSLEHDHRVLVRFIRLSRQNRKLRSLWKKSDSDFVKTLDGLDTNSRMDTKFSP